DAFCAETAAATELELVSPNDLALVIDDEGPRTQGAEASARDREAWLRRSSAGALGGRDLGRRTAVGQAARLNRRVGSKARRLPSGHHDAVVPLGVGRHAHEERAMVRRRPIHGSLERVVGRLAELNEAAVGAGQVGGELDPAHRLDLRADLTQAGRHRARHHAIAVQATATATITASAGPAPTRARGCATRI